MKLVNKASLAILLSSVLSSNVFAAGEMTRTRLIYGVGLDNSVWSIEQGKDQWKKIAGGAVTQIVVSPFGSVYGLSLDGAIYVLEGNSQWRKITDGNVIQFAATADGQFYGIGYDHAVWTTTEGKPWTRVTDPWVSQVAIATNGDIYGLRQDHTVWKTRPGKPWTQVTGAYVTRIVLGPKDELFGLATDHTVVKWKNTFWDRVTTPDVSFFTVASDGSIFGIGTGLEVWTTQENQNWTRVTPGLVDNISVTY